MEIVSGILEILNCLAPPSFAYLDRHRKFKQDVDDLRERVRDLNTRKADIETQLKAEDLSEKLVRKQVKDWLEDVQRVNDGMEEIEEKVRKVSYFFRARLGKLAREKIGELDRISQKGSFPEGLVIDRPQPIGMTLPTENLEGEYDVKTKIWGYLRCREVGMIGVCGIGGVGKTTVMKHIHNELLNEAKTNLLNEAERFGKVIWVTVSHPLNVVKLQGDIASKINVSLPDGDELSRASKLMDIMKKMKYALILDDVWDKFTLQGVGIPEPTTANGCKIIITSRSVDVCNYLGCHIVKVPPLSKQESLNLFLDKVGQDILQVVDLKEILEPIVDECAGLPLAIVLIAGSMRGVKDIHEWKNALRELQKCVAGTVEGSEDEIFHCLKFSYDRLPNPNTQNCFLYCSLYPEDFEISRIELIEHWICEGFIEELGSRRDMHDKGHTILNRIQNNCLLEEANNEGYVKMHDVVRDMAVRIKSNGPHRFIVKAGVGLSKMPNEGEWTEDLEKVSLMENEISYIPVNLSPKCSVLSTLILKGNGGLIQIPECFFDNMVGLKFLDLSSTGIEALPNSMCNLESLAALILRECCNLVCMPSLEKLKMLKKLDLHGAGLLVVPEGIEMLLNLQYLDLCCQRLRELPKGIISNLSCLQYLCTDGLSTEETMRGDGVAGLKMLETFEAGFYDLKDFNSYVMSKHFERLGHYVLSVGPSNGMHFQRFDHLKRIILNGCFIGCVSLVLPDDIQNLVICGFNVELYSDVLKMDKTAALRAPTSPGIFSNLKQLRVMNCESYNLLSCKLLQGFQYLEEVYVFGCRIEEIGWEEEEGNQANTAFTLPKFRKLSVANSEVKKLFLCNLLQGLQSLQNLVEVCISSCSIEEMIAGKEEDGNQTTAASTLPKFRKFSFARSVVKRLFLGKLEQGHQEVYISQCAIEEMIGGKEEDGNQTTVASTLPKFRKISFANSAVERLFLGRLEQGHQEVDISYCAIEEMIAGKEEDGDQTTAASTLPKFRKISFGPSAVVQRLFLGHCFQGPRVIFPSQGYVQEIIDASQYRIEFHDLHTVTYN
ncbi:hypothetical protein SLE2022_254520 [Rubroshorea leprosula]